MDLGVTAKDNRLFIEAVLWIARTGSLWRDLPPEFGFSRGAYTARPLTGLIRYCSLTPPA